METLLFVMDTVEAPLQSTDRVQEDERLLARAKADPQVVGEIYDAYGDKLYGFLYKRCKQKELAEDLTQRVFLKFIEALPKMEWRGVTLGAWLYRVASNALTDHWRSASTRMDLAIDTEEWDLPDHGASPAWYAECKFEEAKLAECVKKLSPRDQEVVDLRYFGGYDVPEIAAQLEISLNHASVLLYRAVGRLRTHYVTLYGRPA